MYGDQTDKYPQYNTDYALKLLVKLGASKDKLVVGVPFYGQTFMLSSSRPNQGHNSQSDGPGEPGEITTQPGMLAYSEICNRLRRPGWKLGKDPAGHSGPHATNNNQWVGFDDVTMVTTKAKYVVNEGYGGVAAWTVDLDDFSNRCCLEAFPLLRAINRALGRLDTPVPSGSNCQRPPSPATPVPPVMMSTVDTGAAGIPVTQWSGQGASESTTTSSWWTQPTTTRKATRPPTATTTEETTRKTTRRTTRRTTVSPNYPEEESTVPVPVNVMPVIVDGACDPGEYRAHPTKCSDYLVCLNGGLITQYCPAGLHWNSRNNHCDWPSSAQCTASNSPAPTQGPVQTTRRTTTERTTTREPSTTRRPPTTTRREPPTSRRTTRWTTRETTEFTEPPTTTRFPETTTRRRTTARPTYSYETTTTYMTTTTKRPHKKPTMCVNGNYYPHKDCSKYYICNNGKRTPIQCPDGTQYSTVLKTCDFTENVKCVSKKKYLKLLQKQYKKSGFFNAALLKASEGDPCEGFEFFSYPGKCAHYLQCNHQTLIDRMCADGLYYDPVSMNCNWKDQVTCTDDPSLESNETGYGESEENEFEEEEANEENEKPALDFDQSKPGVSSTTVRPPKKPASPPKIPSSFETIAVADNVEPLNGPYKLVCYFTNWAWYRPGIGKYLPDNIDENLCTHIVYGFAVLNFDELTIKTHDSWADIDNKFYERVVEFKNKGVKVTLAIGGWNDSAGDKYSRLVRNPAARARFIKHVVEFLEKYGFEGLDLDWEYPVCWQVDCKKGNPDEKRHFAAFVKELSAAFKPRGLLLSSAVSPSKTVIDAGYDVPSLAKYFDWIAVMCYDYHGQWDKKTGHVAPLYYHPEDEVDYFNTVSLFIYFFLISKIIETIYQRNTQCVTGSNSVHHQANLSWECRFMDNHSLWRTLKITDSMLKHQGQVKLGNSLALPVSWLITRFAKESSSKAGRLCKILREEWVHMPTRATNGCHLTIKQH